MVASKGICLNLIINQASWESNARNRQDLQRAVEADLELFHRAFVLLCPTARFYKGVLDIKGLKVSEEEQRLGVARAELNGQVFDLVCFAWQDWFPVLPGEDTANALGWGYRISVSRVEGGA